MCDDIEALLQEVTAHGATVEGGISDQGVGFAGHCSSAQRRSLGVYQPRHPVAAQAIGA
jgi:predicted enzyme related to lactoylglutathione lyase